MAQVAHGIRDSLAAAMASGESSPLAERLLRAYRAEVEREASATKIADTLAQVAVYALFVARCTCSEPRSFSRADLANLPAEHPFLRLLFGTLGCPASVRLPFAAVLDDLAHALAECDLDIVARGVRKALDELIVSFYEAFLRAYDQPTHGRRGVYLTPAPVIRYLVRSVDALLSRELGLQHGLTHGFAHGLAAHGLAHGLAHDDPATRLIIEDPACGTGAFLATVVASAQGTRATGDATPRGQPSQVRGCELLSAPYLLAHLVVGLRLRECPDAANVRIRLGNALDALEGGEDDSVACSLHAAPNGGDEGPRARQISPLAASATLHPTGDSCEPIASDDDAILVMLGNPPYRGHSANQGRGIANLLHGRAPDGQPTETYFALDGMPLKERNTKWLNDDYVKFIRYAQWRIERAGQGILAFVTSSGYLDGPTFRAMRRSLLRSFDALYLLDLHGSARRSERTTDEPRGRPPSRDENVFAIQQGVALSLFVRRRGEPGASRDGQIFVAELRGKRDEKLRWLASHSVVDTSWREVLPCAPLHAFTTQTSIQHDTATSWPLTELMSEHSLGILTKRDALVVGFEPSSLLRQIADFADPTRSDAECATAFALPLRDRDRWDLARARRGLAGAIDGDTVRSYAYRPLDIRTLYYDARLVARPNLRVMHHLARENVALVVGRQGAATGSPVWDVAFVTDQLTDQNLFRRGGACVFPLYLYSDDDRERRANLAPECVAQLGEQLCLAWMSEGRGDLTATFGPEDVLAYVYALLYAPSFRKRHADTLRTDFPSIPLPRDCAIFRALCRLGAQLVALHLGNSPPSSLPRYTGTGNSRVERVSFEPGPDGELAVVTINGTQRFEEVAPEVWAFSIGGYQVARKWLHDRRGRALTDEDVRRYQLVVGILGETRALMRRIDDVLAASDAPA